MKIGFTCGAFDLLHSGHYVMLQECKTICDYLIVGLQTDPTIDRLSKNKPIQTTYERFLQLKGCKYVDEIIPYDTEKDLENIMAIENINIRFVGQEYMGLKITGEDYCNNRNIKILHTSRMHNYSSSNLRKRVEKK